MPAAHADQPFLQEGGSMGALMRAFDWSSTSLGAAARWPQSLKTAVSLMLRARQPVFIGWGPETISLYNDGYVPILGAKHPAALGRPMAAVWSEIWDTLGPMNEAVLRGEAQFFENMPFALAGRADAEPSYFSFSYTPLLDDDGRIGGLFCSAIETTSTLQLAQSRADDMKRTQRLFEQAPGFICTFRGPGHVFEFINDAHRKLFQRPDIVGRTIREAFPDIAGQGIYELLDEVYRSGERQVTKGQKARLTDAPGMPEREVELDFLFTPVFDETGQVSGIFCVGQEVTGAEAAQQALLVREEQLRLATDGAEIAFWDLNLVNDTLFWPPRLRAMFGVADAATVTMRDFYAGLHPEDRDATTAALAAACDPERRALYDVEFRTVGRDDGVVRWVAAKGRAVFDESGRSVRVLGTAIDISARRAAEQAMEVALAASRTGTFHWDIENNRLTWDGALDRLFGLPPGEVVRSLDQFVALVHPDDRDGVIARCMRCRDFAEDFEMEFRVVYPDGSVRWLYDRGRTFADGAGRGRTMTGACVDITELWEAQQALRRADRQKDEFLATLAHELRNPLAPLRTGLQVLRRGGEEEVRKVREIMERQLNHMVRLVDELLDIARISQGKIVLCCETVPLHGLLEQAVEASRPLLDAHGHTLVWEPADPRWLVHGDPTRLVQVLGNLLNNAAKYTPRGGRVTLRAREQGEGLEIEVQDTGVGIPADLLDSVFERFVQVEQHVERAQGGLGIGLSVVKSLAEMHGGRVWADSAGPGQGSRFVLWLPRAAAQSAAAAVEAVQPLPGARRKVLIVDDNRDAAETLAMVVEMGGHEVHLAHDGIAALDMVRAHQPSVVFLDIGMPGMNGYETAGRLRALPGGDSRTLVALTGWGSEDDRARSFDAGFDVHLTKPVEFGAVEGVLAAPPRPGTAAAPALG